MSAKLEFIYVHMGEAPADEQYGGMWHFYRPEEHEEGIGGLTASLTLDGNQFDALGEPERIEVTVEPGNVCKCPAHMAFHALNCPEHPGEPLSAFGQSVRNMQRVLNAPATARRLKNSLLTYADEIESEGYRVLAKQMRDEADKEGM